MFFGDTDLPHAPLCNNSTQRDESQIIVFRGNNNILHMYQHKFYKIKKLRKEPLMKRQRTPYPIFSITDCLLEHQGALVVSSGQRS